MALPEDKLRNRSFFKRRWLKTTMPYQPVTLNSTQQPATIRSGALEGASTITLNSFNSTATINGNEMYPIFNFGGLFLIVILLCSFNDFCSSRTSTGTRRERIGDSFLRSNNQRCFEFEQKCLFSSKFSSNQQRRDRK